MHSSRENWGSKLGVILAVAGSAVGLGNFLRFPVQAATNGGGTFIIPYLIAFLVLGIPLSWIEWTLGRYAGILRHGTSPGAYDKIIGKRWGKYLGSIGLLPPLFIIFYYVFIESWILAFTYYSVTGKLMAVVEAGKITEFFGNFIHLKESIGPFPAAVVFFAITFVCNMALISLGVRKGIERANKISMPILFIMGIILVIRVLTLPDIGKGLAFMWNPDFSALTNPQVWLAAAGQVFFTMSLGMGIVFCYASYTRRNEDIVLSSLSADSANVFAEIILGGTIVIPLAVLVIGANIDECAKMGTFGLAFQSMPLVFGKIPFGSAFMTLWFAMLFVAGVTSAISIIQPLISFCEDDLKFSRRTSVGIIGFISLLGGTLSIVGLAAGAVEELDFWGGNFLLVLLGTIEAIVFSFVLGRKKSKEYPGESEAFALLNEGAALKLPRIFRVIIRYVCPAALVTLLVAWFIQNGTNVLLLRHISDDATITFAGLTLSKKAFTVGFRLFLVVAALLVNVAIWYAWKSGRAESGRSDKVKFVSVGNSDEEA